MNKTNLKLQKERCINLLHKYLPYFINKGLICTTEGEDVNVETIILLHAQKKITDVVYYFRSMDSLIEEINGQIPIEEMAKVLISDYIKDLQVYEMPTEWNFKSKNIQKFGNNYSCKLELELIDIDSKEKHLRNFDFNIYKNLSMFFTTTGDMGSDPINQLPILSIMFDFHILPIPINEFKKLVEFGLIKEIIPRSNDVSVDITMEDVLPIWKKYYPKIELHKANFAGVIESFKDDKDHEDYPEYYPKFVLEIYDLIKNKNNGFI